MPVSSNQVLGKYRILREIARSNDIVYEAIDAAMGRRVAIKELQLPSHLSGSQKRERIERFYREAKAAGALTHPNIVTIHEVGQENDRHFIAMEYLEGQSLRDIQQMQGALPLKESLEIALQLCDALAYAHAHGVIHRDIKPDNVHILPGGVIKLTDFGIARITAEPGITSQGQVFGTPSYMSPEQVASRTVDHRTDLFSLGITLYEMLTGRKPFIGDSVITITYNIMNVQPPMPVGVPATLHGILQKALAKDPNLRYQSAAAMANDLRAEKFGIESPRSTSPGHARMGSMTFQPPAGATTLDTGTVPPEFNGLGAAGSPGEPTIDSALAAQAAAAVRSNRAPADPNAPGGRRPDRTPSSQARSLASLIVSVIGVLLLLALIVWACQAVVSAVRARSHQQKAHALNRKGMQALGGSDYSRAVLAYEEARRAAPPGSDEAHQAQTGLADVAIAQGQHAAQNNKPAVAQEDYLKAIALDARNAEAYNNLGNLRWKEGDWQNALQYWDSAIQADPTSPAAADARRNATQTYMDQAQQALAANNVVQARRYWQRVMEINPGSDAALVAQQHIDGTSPSAAASTGESPTP